MSRRKTYEDLDAPNQQDMEQGQKHDVTSAPTGPYPHGNGGLFSQPGQDRRVFSTIKFPTLGILGDLPIVYDSEIENGFGGYEADIFTTVTGVKKGNMSDANQPRAACDRWPTGGLMKTGSVYSPKGRFGLSLQTLDLSKVGKLRDRADPANLELLNMPRTAGNPLMPTVPGGLNPRAILNNAFTQRAFTASTEFVRELSKKIWTGNPANSLNSDKWKDLLGLNLQVNKGNHRDFVSSAVLTALDSDVKNFDYQLVNQSTPRDIVYYLETLMDFLNVRDDLIGIGPVFRKIYMRPELFRIIAGIWPIRQYQEAMGQINQFSNGRVVIDATGAQANRNDYITNRYLPILGERYAVVPDWGIPEQTPNTTSRLRAGQYASDIYIMPLTILGGQRTLYIRPYRQDNAITEAVVRDGRLMHTWTSDGGMFRWYNYATGPCIDWEFETEFGINFHTPQLAGRLMNVAYEPLQHYDSPYPEDVDYFPNGGVTERGEVAYYNDWSEIPYTVG